MFESVFEIDPDSTEVELRIQVERLERMKSAAAAAQARATALWRSKRRAAETATGVPAARRGRGLACEVALARRDSPVRGATHLGLASALVEEMPHTLAALECGALSEWRATLIVRESACLRGEHRRELDAELCADVSRLDGWGDKRVVAEAKAIAARLDVEAVVARSATAAKDRRVTVRPAPGTMTYVTALLPVAQGVAVYAALKRAADTTLAGDDDAPGWLADYGPIPAGFARTLTGRASADAAVKTMLRRLYRRPRSGQLVAMESQARIFPKGLATFLDLRDRTCRTPYCDAPIRQHDHARPAHRGGSTSALNGLGECEACNYTKEAPGWAVTTTDADGAHTAEFRTPTGAVYRSTAPPLPGPPIRTVSVIECGLSVDLVWFDAA